MYLSLIFLLAILPSMFTNAAVVNKTADGDLRTWGQLDFQIQVCTSAGNCQTENNGVHIDAAWLGCSNPIGCTNIPGLAEYTGWGVSTSANQIRFEYTGPGSARVYVVAPNGADKYRMFALLNQELRFDVDLSTWGCGLNAALYFVAMPEDGGESIGYAGPSYGTGYCDAQAPVPPYQKSCVELDVLESNSLSHALTTHGCDASGKCDPAGCAINPYGQGDKTFFGRGSTFKVDTTKPFTIVTRFVTDNGQDTGNLKDIQRFYVQNGQTIQSPTFDGYSALSDAYCTHFGKPNLGGITASMGAAMKNKMVMALSWWGNAGASNSMNWLDQPPAGPCPAYTNTVGNAFKFSNVKIGPIGSTL